MAPPRLLPATPLPTPEQALVHETMSEAWLTSLLPARARRWAPQWKSFCLALLCHVGMGSYLVLRSFFGFLPCESAMRRLSRDQRFAPPTAALHLDAFPRVLATGAVQLALVRGILPKEAAALIRANPYVALSEDETAIRKEARFDPSTGLATGFVFPNGTYERERFVIDCEKKLNDVFAKDGTGALLADQMLVFMVTFTHFPELTPIPVLYLGTAKNKHRDPRKTGRILDEWCLLVRLARSAGLKVLTAGADGAQISAGEALRDVKPPAGVGTVYKRNITGGDGRPLAIVAPVFFDCIFVYFSDFLHLIVNLMARLSCTSRGAMKGVFLGATRISLLYFQKAVELLTPGQRVGAGFSVSDLRGRDRQNFGRCWRMLQPKALATLELLATSLEAKATLLVMYWVFRGPLALMSPDMDPMARLLDVARTYYFVISWVALNKSKKLNMLTTCVSTAVVSFLFLLPRTLTRCAQKNGLYVNFMSLVMLYCWIIDNERWEVPVNTNKFSSQACESLFRALRSFHDRTFSLLVANERMQAVSLRRVLGGVGSARRSSNRGSSLDSFMRGGVASDVAHTRLRQGTTIENVEETLVSVCCHFGATYSRITRRSWPGPRCRRRWRSTWPTRRRLRRGRRIAPSRRPRRATPCPMVTAWNARAAACSFAAWPIAVLGLSTRTASRPTSGAATRAWSSRSPQTASCLTTPCRAPTTMTT